MKFNTTKMDKEASLLELIYEYDLDKEHRIVYFNSDVDEEPTDRTIKNLRYLDRVSNADITFHICSYGGSVDHMFAIYDCVQSLNANVHTIGTGAICSAAVLLLACGTTRKATENAWLMAHKAVTYAQGDEDLIDAQVEVFKKYEEKRYNLLERHTKWTADEWRSREKDKREVWMDPREMIEAGVIDEVITPKHIPKKPRRRTTRKRVTKK